MIISPADRRRVESKLRPVAGGCLVWGPDGSRHWYKTVTVRGKRYNLRRLLYALNRGMASLPPPAVRLRSTCNNPACHNPLHLLEADVVSGKKYPWDDWLTPGPERVLVRGTDFQCSTASMRQQIRNAVRAAGLFVTIRGLRPNRSFRFTVRATR